MYKKNNKVIFLEINGASINKVHLTHPDNAAQ